MKLSYRFYVVMVVAALFFCLGGIRPQNGDDGAEKQAKAKPGTVALFYINTSEDGFHTVAYDLENAGDALSAAYEIIYKLSETESSNTNSYKPSIFDGVTVNSLSVDDGEITVDMGAGYRQLSASKEILLRASVVKSLTQIEGVKSVRFTINGDSLLGSDDNPVGSMGRHSFILEENRDDLYNESAKVTLYYANKKGDGLTEYETRLKTENGRKIETLALEKLLEKPDGLEGQVPLPSNLKINSTQIHNKVCYVDLNKEIYNGLPGVEEEVMVYAMVNTVTSLGNASAVQFTIEGKRVKKLREFDSFHLLMTNDYSLCSQTKKEKKKS
ncbi:MAG: GerMN domain-containing protein [Eubacteriales bacterium]|nr:GerMN domain-containing protein [Eubacteriales bacterium]